MSEDHGREAEPRLNAAAERLNGRLDEVTGSMVARILAEVPVYRRLPPDGLSNVEQLASRNSRVLTEALAAGTGLDREDLRYVADHARERVRRGVSLESMLHAYRVGLTAFWEECIAEGVALGLSRDAALELARRTSELSDDLTTHAAETYVREEARLRAHSDRAARDMLELMLRGEADAESLGASRAAPGLDSATRLVVVIARVDARTAHADALGTTSDALTRTLSTRRASALVAARSGAVIAVAPLEDDHSVTPALTAAATALRAEGTHMVCGLSTPLEGFAAVPAGFDQAVLAASQTSTERPVVSLSELSVIENLVLGATTTTRAMLLHQAENLLPDAKRSLAPMKFTLQAFAETNMNVTRAAKRLHIHPNTLRYRLRRVLEQTGRDPHSFGDLLDLLCLVTLLSQPDLESPTRRSAHPRP